MGGTALVAVIGAADHLGVARARLDDLEAKWSRFRPDSEIRRLAADRFAHHGVSADTRLLLWRSFAAWSRTDGAFDPSVLDALVAWGYDRSLDEIGRRTAPADTVVAPGLGRLEIDDVAGTACLGGVGFDPGGIGKGLAADLVVEELLEAGATAVLVDVCGDLAVGGPPALDGRVPAAWAVGVEDPLDPACELCRMQLTGGGLATSSDRRRRWQVGEGDAHHLIDPRTGAPADTDLAGATVLAGAAWWAEALTKAVLLGDLDIVDLGQHGASGIGRRRTGEVVGTPDLVQLREAS